MKGICNAKLFFSSSERTPVMPLDLNDTAKTLAKLKAQAQALQKAAAEGAKAGGKMQDVSKGAKKLEGELKDEE